MNKRAYHTYGRAVCDEEINAFRNFGPLGLEWLSPVEVEGPVAKSWLPGAPINPDALYLALFILKIGAVGEGALDARGVEHVCVMEALPELRVRFKVEGQVVVARDDDLVCVWQRRKPGVELLHFDFAAS